MKRRYEVNVVNLRELVDVIHENWEYAVEGLHDSIICDIIDMAMEGDRGCGNRATVSFIEVWNPLLPHSFRRISCKKQKRVGYYTLSDMEKARIWESDFPLMNFRDYHSRWKRLFVRKNKVCEINRKKFDKKMKLAKELYDDTP